MGTVRNRSGPKNVSQRGAKLAYYNSRPTKGENFMVSFGRTSVADKTQTLKVGDQAPDFELPGHRGGEKFKLSDLRGKKNVVLVFYPLDWTPV
jgi:AhpC/TSA family